ncbi:DUF2442 domain-containing protein [Thermoleptolyngbya oregonensis]|uniref:DUF2442 domain-containing protein n=1 Tax=Thermoleptolyngbya oregonensis TaxID=2303529 RepID=UPI00292E76F5|nr:DUF2442 domain-containing protein [Thermoleptolyngbya oregonensis]
MLLVCYPRLRNAAPKQRKRWTICGGYGIHWKEPDEDLKGYGVRLLRVLGF